MSLKYRKLLLLVITLFSIAFCLVTLPIFMSHNNNQHSQETTTIINQNLSNIDTSNINNSSLRNGLKAEYYDNQDFTALKLTRYDPTIDFDWGRGAPDSSLGADTFSVRWTGQIEPLFSEKYTFHTTSDDGVRLWINERLIIDYFSDQPATEHIGTINLVAGKKYDIKLEYYDNQYSAVAQLAWSSSSQAYEIVPESQLYSPATDTTIPVDTLGTGDGLKAEYYDNQDFTNLKLTRTDPTIDFDWGRDAPDPSLGAETFSVRWTGQIEALFSENYTFHTTTDDGVRLWINDRLIIDHFSDQPATEHNGTIDLVAGKKYDIKLEYYDNQYSAVAQLAWSSPSQAYEIVPQSQLYSQATTNEPDPPVEQPDPPVEEPIPSQPTDGSFPDQPNPVKIGGGGFVTGILTHPEDPNLIYARTDVGGLYRWDPTTQEWHQLLSIDNVGEKVSLAVESIAIAPNDPDIIYAATGAYTHDGKGNEIPGHLLKSVDRGVTWEVMDLSVPMGGNSEWRWAGERLAVDPNNSNVVYFGSRLDGLWQSQDGGQSWNQINTQTIPVGEAFGQTSGLAGVTFVEFDRSSSTVNGKTQVIYVGVAGKGVYQTRDGGNTWQSLSGGPGNDLIAQQGEVNADGELVVTFYDPDGSNGAVWQFNGSSWQNVTPSGGKNYAGLTVSESDPNVLYTMTYPMTPDDIYRSTDGGDTWTALNNEYQGLDWWPSWSFWTLSGDLAVNPTDSNQVWLTNGFGIWNTESANSSTVNWSAAVEGVEETVPFDAVSTPGGASLITAIADFDGFRHSDLDAVPSKNHSNGGFSTTTSIDYSSGNPNFVVRVGGNHNKPWERQAGFSTDNGVTWQNFASVTNGNHPGDLSFGNIAVSATNTNNLVWQGTDWVAPYYTKDGGATWNKISYFDQQFGGGAHTHLWNSQQILAADSVTDGTFYLYHHVGGKLVRTQNGGESWSVVNQDNLLPSGEWTGVNLNTMPGVAGEVWVSFEDKGLYRSSNGGQTFTQITSVDYADAFGFGKAAAGTETPTLFVSGEIDGVKGVFGSTDLGNSWSQVPDLPNEFLGDVRSVVGDMNDFGRVYLGVASNGFIYGDLDS
jgi:photosystem II stability/assembly factor-like uncharacterized protein